jgi:hypothetical protein
MTESLMELFFAATDSAMVQHGWQSSCVAPFHVLPVQGRYLRPGEGKVAAVAQLDWDDSYSTIKKLGGAAVAVVEARIGVTCPPAERLLAALGARWVNATIDEDAGVAAGGKELRIRIADEDDVMAAVAAVVVAIDASAPQFASEHSTVDAFVDAHRVDGDEDEFNGEVIPATYAVSARGTEALESLREYRTSYRDADYDAFARRLEEFVAAKRGAPEPSATVFAHLRGEPAAPAGEAQQQWPPSLGTQQQDGEAGSQSARERGWAKLAVWFLDLARVVRRGGIGGLPPSEGRWCEVDVSDAVEPTLSSAHAEATTRILDTVYVPARLERPASDEAHPADVFLGEQLVGRVAGDTMVSSGRVLARLTATGEPPRYSLEVQVPKASNEE